MPLDLATILILVSGLTHAIVNAIVKSGKDKMSSRALVDGFSALLIAPAILVLPLPHGAWTWLGLSWLTHLIYTFCLIKAFERADMSAAYPIMRGTAPVLASIMAVAFIGDPITPAIVIGVILVSLGTFIVSFRQHPDSRSILWALATGISIAVYTVIDARGVRAAPSAPSYIAWLFLMLGAGIASLFAAWRGGRFVLAARSEWKAGLIAGALSLVSYGFALGAFRLGDVPRLAALRETSILFGVLIAVVFLKEKVTMVRALGAIIIAGGSGLLLISG